MANANYDQISSSKSWTSPSRSSLSSLSYSSLREWLTDYLNSKLVVKNKEFSKLLNWDTADHNKLTPS